jgi:DNA recombination protein RmuC
VYLPDRTKINVDVKFPYANLQKSTATEDKEAKKQLMKQFETDVREKIKQITTREYINPEDKTVDFVILFVPNEMIFSYIYEHMNDVWRDAMEKKVVFVGPFSFTALLRMVRQAYENFRYQENIHQMISHIKRFEIEFDKYNEEFNKIGDYIHRLSTQYSQVETTRTKQLVRVVEKIRLEDKSPVKKTLLPPISS